MDFDRFPRIPRRRAVIAGAILRWLAVWAGAVFIAWLAAQGF